MQHVVSRRVNVSVKPAGKVIIAIALAMKELMVTTVQRNATVKTMEPAIHKLVNAHAVRDTWENIASRNVHSKRLDMNANKSVIVISIIPLLVILSTGNACASHHLQVI